MDSFTSLEAELMADGGPHWLEGDLGGGRQRRLSEGASSEVGTVEERRCAARFMPWGWREEGGESNAATEGS